MIRDMSLTKASSDFTGARQKRPASSAISYRSEGLIAPWAQAMRVILPLLLITWLGPTQVRATLVAPFTRITTNTIATEVFESQNAAWGDYDNDGFLDLFVGNNGARNSFFHNNGNGTFTKITTGAIATFAADNPHSAAWVDYDNDGWPDLLIGQLTGKVNPLFHNKGDGTFELVGPPQAGDVASSAGVSVSVSFADYDGDGQLDLFVANGALVQAEEDFLFHNEGNGRFAKVTSSALTGNVLHSTQGSWADFDNDGDLDLLVTHYGDAPNTLFRNDGDGNFTNVTEAAGLGDIGQSVGAAWGDFDNDGDLDLIITNYRFSGLNLQNFFYRNQGNGTFTRITDGVIATDTGHFLSAAWIDYDNDGRLDLFITADPSSAGNNRLYHNEGNGTFIKVTEGRLVTDRANPTGCAWGDYDNDGFLDAYVANGGPIGGAQRNGLYHNDGNGNSWIKIRCVGTKSNRSAIGTKVSVKATIAGQDRWQIRQIVGNEGWLSFNALDAVIGLGDAATIQTIRVEWPSGLVQELHDVAAKQTLTITESAAPVLQAAKTAKGLKLTWDNSDYLLERTTELSSPGWQAAPGVAGTSHEVIFEEKMFFRLRHR